MSVSLLDALAGIGEPAKHPLAIPSAFRGRMSSSLLKAMEGMTDPDVAQWHKIGVALYSENTEVMGARAPESLPGAPWGSETGKATQVRGWATETDWEQPTPCSRNL